MCNLSCTNRPSHIWSWTHWKLKSVEQNSEVNGRIFSLSDITNITSINLIIFRLALSINILHRATMKHSCSNLLFILRVHIIKRKYVTTNKRRHQFNSTQPLKYTIYKNRDYSILMYKIVTNSQHICYHYIPHKVWRTYYR